MANFDYENREEMVDTFLYKLWSTLKVAKRQPIISSFEIDLGNFTNAVNWVLLFDPTYDVTLLSPPNPKDKICHSQKKVLWEKSFISARALEPILGYGFHRCDDGSQTCSLFLQSSVVNVQSVPLRLKLVWYCVTSYRSDESETKINMSTVRCKIHHVLSCSFKGIVTKINAEKGNLELAELYAASSSQ
jgi:hypothetical protein